MLVWGSPPTEMFHPLVPAMFSKDWDQVLDMGSAARGNMPRELLITKLSSSWEMSNLIRDSTSWKPSKINHRPLWTNMMFAIKLPMIMQKPLDKLWILPLIKVEQIWPIIFKGQRILLLKLRGMEIPLEMQLALEVPLVDHKPRLLKASQTLCHLTTAHMPLKTL